MIQLMDLSSRLSASERLDAAEHDLAQLELTLDHLVDVNRWLGGTRVVLAHLAKWLPTEAAVRVLDVGTGAGDIPGAVARWAAKRGRVVDICAVDLRGCQLEQTVKHDPGRSQHAGAQGQAPCHP